MKIFGENNWEPMSQEINRDLERFLLLSAVREYERMWDELFSAHAIQADDIGLEVKRYIRSKVNQGVPFSIIRMNDGEGTVVLNENADLTDGLKNYMNDRISKIIFGDGSVVKESATDFLNLMKLSIENSDVIGLPERSFVRRRLYEAEKGNVDIRAVLGSFGQVKYMHKMMKSGLIKSNVKVTSAWLSKYLLSHYKEIMSWFKQVVVITGNEGLGALISGSFDINSVREISIPTQRSMSSGSEDVRHWPNRYKEVMHEIEELGPGSLVLVAAGLLGKAYCSYAKECGNSSIDIGHVADIWFGKQTRPGVRDEFIEKWALAGK